MKTKRVRILAWTISFALIAQTALPANAQNDTTYGEYRSGSMAGIQENYTEIVIKTEEDLYAFAENCKLDTWSADKRVVLDADIALEQHKDLSIQSFGGIFDGQGHKIGNLQLEVFGSHVGLFRYVQEKGQIKNLSVYAKVEPDGTRSQVGGIAGINYGTITDCVFSGLAKGDCEVGGIAGVNGERGVIRRCESVGVVVGNHSVGGIVGSNLGVVSVCRNSGKVDTYREEVSYNLEDFTIERLDDVNSAQNITAHTDTGGIAGISSGKIYGCANLGEIGYSHVGYNVGGIVGRVSQGYVYNCSNQGQVKGRKDVGGVAGQMEPFMEGVYLADKLNQLDREVDKLFDLMEAAGDDLHSTGSQAADAMREVNGSLNGARREGKSLIDKGEKLWYIYNQEIGKIGGALDELAGTGKKPDVSGGDTPHVTGGDTPAVTDGNLPGPGTGETTGVRRDGRYPAQAQGAWMKLGAVSRKRLYAMNEGGGNESGGSENGGSTGGSESSGSETGGNESGGSEGGGSESSGSETGGNESSGSEGSETGGGEGGSGSGDTSGNEGGDVSGNGGGGTGGGTGGTTPVTPPLPFDPSKFLQGVDLNSYLAAVKKFGATASDSVDAMHNATNKYSKRMEKDMDELDENLIDALNGLDRLINILDAGGDKLDADLDAVNRQAKVVRNLITQIRTDLFAYEAASMKDASYSYAGDVRKGFLSDRDEELDQISTEEIYDTSSFQKGKIENCFNNGVVEADTAVGGIVGQVALEYDADPEDDIAYTAEAGLNLERTVKAVVRDSVNLGEVTGKKNYIGGIAGRMEFGVVISCESYADIDSSDGSFVGGIAGDSKYTIRSCYSMGKISGKDKVGGIVGKGCDLFGCFAYNEFDVAGESVGAIAGSLADEGTLYENYYVYGGVGGVDNIGYENGATPLSYEQFTGTGILPEAFGNFTVVFRVDEKVIGSAKVSYGGAVQTKDIPEIPAMDGFYGVWPEFDFENVKANRTLDAEYIRYDGSLCSGERDENGRVRMMAEGRFLPGAALHITQDGDVTGVSIEQPLLFAGQITEEMVPYNQPFKMRVLCREPKRTQIYTQQDGVYRKTETRVIGSYVEFPMLGDGNFRVVEERGGGAAALWIALLCGAAGIALLIWLLPKRKDRGGRQKIRAVLFDMDGTLIDTEKYYRKYWPLALEQFGYSMTDEQALYMRSLGRPFAPAKLKEWFGEDLDYAKVREKRKELMEKALQENGIEVKPGAAEILQFLKSRGIRTAVVTATDPARANRYLERTGLLKRFDRVISATQVRQGKPAPDIYAFACKELGLSPKECLVVEDSPNGIRSGHAAGCRVVMVPDQTQPDEELRKILFACVETLSEIRDIIGY